MALLRPAEVPPWAGLVALRGGGGVRGMIGCSGTHFFYRLARHYVDASGKAVTRLDVHSHKRCVGIVVYNDPFSPIPFIV